MGSHPINLALRFLLELAAWGSMAYWGRTQGNDWLRVFLPVGIFFFAIGVWGTFAVPNDPSRSGKAPVPVPGIVRLLLELATFGLGIAALFDMGYTTLGTIFAALTVIHYLASYDRVGWLLKQ